MGITQTPIISAAEQCSLATDKKTALNSRKAPSCDAQPALLITPAGPVPEDKLSHVPPGKRVRRTPQGDYFIEDVTSPDNTSNSQGGAGFSKAENSDG